MERPPSSIQLITMCLQIALKSKRIIWLPLIGFVINASVSILVLTPLAQYASRSAQLHTLSGSALFEYFIILIVLVFLIHQIIFYINSAVMIFIDQQQQHRSPSILNSLKGALHSLWPMYLWHTFAALIGPWFAIFHIKWIEQDWYKRWVHQLLWIYATFLAHPVITFEKSLPIKTVRRSSALMQQTWGAPLTINYSFGWLITLFQAIALLPAIIALIKHAPLNMLIFAIIVTFILSSFVSVLNSLTRNVLQYVIYIYTKNRVSVQPFTISSLKRLYITRN